MPTFVTLNFANSVVQFIVMFRSRFTEAFPKSLANFGPQELERDIVDTAPGELVENFLCALLGLLLNRKQDIKPGHYGRALEEAIQTHKAQWARDWESKNPLLGGATFASMDPTQRLTLLRTLILWSLSSSDAVRGIINNSYKQNRHEDDLNQPLSVQPWGSDSYRRRYYLIEGLDDTAFRVYRESNVAKLERTWWSVAGDIEELKQLAEKLNTEDGGQRARTLSTKMRAAVPRFEATEEKRKRREYRQIRKNQFKRPTEPMFSMYEGRTRGKRIKYTYSDEEDEYDSDENKSTRRSTRNTGTHTPAEPFGPIITQSGRQVRSRQGGAYGESVLSGTRGSSAAAEEENATADNDGGVQSGRPSRRAAAAAATAISGPSRSRVAHYNSLDDMDDEDDASEQDYGDDDEDDDIVPLADDNDVEASDEDMADAEEESSEKKKILVVTLPLKTPTPEKKPLMRLKVSSEKKVGDAIDTVAEGPSPNRKLFDKTEPSSATPATATADDATPLGSAQDSSNKSPAEETATSAIIPLLEPEAPLSPTLAFRGSPQKSPVLNRS